MTAERKTSSGTPQHTAASPDVPELVAAGPDQKNWRGIGIALLVILAVCALIVTAVVLLTPGDKGHGIKTGKFNLNQVISGYYSPNRFNGTWISEKEFVYRDSDGALALYDAEKASTTVLMPNTTFRQYDVQAYKLSADRRYVLLMRNIKKIYRHTYEADYRIYNISNDYVFPLVPEYSKFPHIQYVTWGPKGSQVVYVYENNIYYIPEVTLMPKPRLIIGNGQKGLIFNGIPDWIYEEEILSSNNAIWWSKDGTKLCYGSFNDTEVDTMSYAWYGAFEDPYNVYPETINLKYPKPGRVNPTISLWIADLETGQKPKQVFPPKEYLNQEYYFTAVNWIDNNRLSVIWLRRAQNSSVVSICKKSEGWTCVQHIQEDSNGRGWVDLYSSPVFSTDKSHYFLRLPSLQGDTGYFRHVAMIRMENSKKEFLSKGDFDVTKVLAYRNDINAVYYLSTLKGKPGEQHLFVVRDINQFTKTTECLTCDLGNKCLYNNAIFSPESNYYILECLGPDIPRIELRSSLDNKIITVLETNNGLREEIDKIALPQVRTFQVPVEGGYNAFVRLFLPPTLRDDEITKYPMLVNVYGGPDSQMVNEKFQIHWGTYLASNKNYIYVWIDGRGSGNKGDKLLHEIYRQLGSVEVEDQISVARYLKDDLPFIDSARIGIWGWSYGGYITAMALATDSEVFNCGISVAPVTNWLYYDSVYTERYMQLPRPDDNFIGYERGDVMKKAANFKGKKYLLVHGTADDNVHFQQSMMLTKALTEAGVIFRTQIYPDESHSLADVKIHLYRTMEDFLEQCFIPEEEEEDAGNLKFFSMTSDR